MCLLRDSLAYETRLPEVYSHHVMDSEDRFPISCCNRPGGIAADMQAPRHAWTSSKSNDIDVLDPQSAL